MTAGFPIATTVPFVTAKVTACVCISIVAGRLAVGSSSDECTPAVKFTYARETGFGPGVLTFVSAATSIRRWVAEFGITVSPIT